MVERPIPRVPEENPVLTSDGKISELWSTWLRIIQDSFRKSEYFTAALDVASVSANTSAEQTFSVRGLVTSDVVLVNKPALDAGLIIGNARVSAADTLAITFGNLTGSPINPGSETYNIYAFRG